MPLVYSQAPHALIGLSSTATPEGVFRRVAWGRRSLMQRPLVCRMRMPFDILLLGGNGGAYEFQVAGSGTRELEDTRMMRKVAGMLFASLLAPTGPFLLAQSWQWGRSPFPRDGACFFKDPDFKGDYFCAQAGEALSAVPTDMNDKVSSIRIFGRADVTVFKDVRFDGGSRRFRGSTTNLKDDGWNDRISSFRVGGSSDQGGGQDPDRIVRRAYEDILHRQPDQQGLRLYRSRMIDDGWTEQQVRDALRSSPEYRELTTITPAKAQEIVRRAYLAVLKREPDAGSQGYVNRVFHDHWTQADVERELRKAPEYRNR